MYIYIYIYTHTLHTNIKYVASKITKESSMRKRESPIHINLITMTSISLFCCCKKVFTHKNYE